MKKLKFITITISSLLLLASCNGLKPAKTSLVTITVGGHQSSLNKAGGPATLIAGLTGPSARAQRAPSGAAIPSNVSTIKVTVTAPDMDTITTTVPVAGLSDVTITIEVPNGLNRTFLVEGLDTNAKVVYRGQATADLTGTPLSLTITLINLSDVTPPVFSGLSLISNITSTGMLLSWSTATDNVTPSNGIVYLIYQASSPGGEIYTSPTYSTTAGATSFTVAGLSQGATYYFVVRAEDLAGNIDGNVIELSGAVPDVTPPTFGGLTLVSNITGTTALLSWSAATDNATPSTGIVYLIYLATSPSGENYASPTYTTPAGVTSYTVSGLTPGVTYYFVVRAKDAAGNIDSNTLEGTTTTPDTIPPTFGGLSLVSNVTQTSALLSWAPATDNVTPQANIVYLIYQATAPGGENFASPSYTTIAGATSYTVNGLAVGATYYFVVRAQDAAGNIDGNTIEMTGYYPGTYVDVNTGLDQTGCGAPNQPCQTITYALSQPTGTTPPTVLVAPGIYSSSTSSIAPSETFPLQLPTGAMLFCYGPNFSTVLDDSAGFATAGLVINPVNGQGGTLVQGCQVNTVTTAPAINDNGFPMIINNCSVNGGGFNMGVGVNLSSVSSAVLNSTITGFSGDGSGEGISVSADALISGNTVTGTWDGINIIAGSPVIIGNSLTENVNGFNILDGSPTIDSNTIANNSNAGIMSSSTSTTISPVISNNTSISGSYYGIYIYQGTWTISGNTISGNTIYGIEIYAYSNVGGSITGNTIVNNATGVDINGTYFTLPSINNNSLSCNSTADLNTLVYSTTIDATNNAWDNAPPTTATPSVAPCPAGTDICYSGTVPDFTGYSAVAFPCLP